MISFTSEELRHLKATFCSVPYHALSQGWASRSVIGGWDEFVKECEVNFDQSIVNYRSGLFLRVQFEKHIQKIEIMGLSKKVRSRIADLDLAFERCCRLVLPELFIREDTASRVEGGLLLNRVPLNSSVEFCEDLEFLLSVDPRRNWRQDLEKQEGSFQLSASDRIHFFGRKMVNWAWNALKCKYGYSDSLIDFNLRATNRVKLQIALEKEFPKAHSILSKTLAEIDKVYLNNTIASPSSDKTSGLSNENYRELDVLLRSRLPKHPIGDVKSDIENAFGKDWIFGE